MYIKYQQLKIKYHKEMKIRIENDNCIVMVMIHFRIFSQSQNLHNINLCMLLIIDRPR